MKKLAFYVIFSAILLSSCSNSGNQIEDSQKADTLRQYIKNKEESTSWTQELESDRLTKNISQIDSVSSSMSLTPDLLKISAIQGEKIYPVVNDFGSLDTSNLSERVYSVSKKFADSFLRDKKSLEPLFEKSAFFSYVLFLYDLKDDKRNFNKYLIGRGLDDEGKSQVPIRFLNEDDFLDVVIYVSEETGQIAQIKIVNLQKN